VLSIDTVLCPPEVTFAKRSAEFILGVKVSVPIDIAFVNTVET